MAKTNHDQKETSSVKPLNLADEYAQRHRQMENYIFIWHISFAILRRFGIDPVSNKGRILLAFGFTMVLCLLAVVTSAITRQWDQLQSFTWVPVAIGLGFIVGFAYSWYLSATDDFLTIHQAIKDDAGLRWLIAWDRRWFNVRVVGLIGFTYTIIVLIGLYIIRNRSRVL